MKSLRYFFRSGPGNILKPSCSLPVSGSDRRYFRLTKGNISAIGAWNPVKEENLAFLHFSRHFLANGLHVPAIYGEDPENDVYLLEDLGNSSLFSLLENNTPGIQELQMEIIRIYKESLKELIRFQVIAGKSLDYSYCYPYSSFDSPFHEVGPELFQVLFSEIACAFP